LTKKLVVLGSAALLLLLAGGGFLYWRFVCCYGVVQRQPRVVEDLSPYGDELRSLGDDSPTNVQEYRPGTPTYSGPGWYPRWSPDRSLLAVTTNGAGFYHTVNFWDERSHRLTPVVSIKEADPGSGVAHRYAWSQDSQALLIYGRGSLVSGESLPKLCLVYLPRRDELSALTKCPAYQCAVGSLSVPGGAVQLTLETDQRSWSSDRDVAIRLIAGNTRQAEVSIRSAHLLLQPATNRQSLSKAGFMSVPLDVKTGRAQNQGSLSASTLGPQAETTAEVANPQRILWTGYSNGVFGERGVFGDLYSKAKSGAYVLTVEAQVRANGSASSAQDWSCLASNEVAIELQGGSAPAGGS
jgi:hypothetical protein